MVRTALYRRSPCRDAAFHSMMRSRGFPRAAAGGCRRARSGGIDREPFLREQRLDVLVVAIHGEIRERFDDVLIQRANGLSLLDVLRPGIDLFLQVAIRYDYGRVEADERQAGDADNHRHPKLKRAQHDTLKGSSDRVPIANKTLGEQDIGRAVGSDNQKSTIPKTSRALNVIAASHAVDAFGQERQSPRIIRSIRAQ